METSSKELIESRPSVTHYPGRVEYTQKRRLPKHTPTPLNVISEFSQVIQDRKANPIKTERQEFLGLILEYGNSLLALINEILTL